MIGACVCLAGLSAAGLTAAGDPAQPGDGFVSLFNGKDLTGWKSHPDGVAKWSVKDGAITATGETGHLFSERGDYANFVYRVEAKINDGGNSGQYFRAKYGKSWPTGYEAQINATHKDTIKTGSLYPAFLPKAEQAEFLAKYGVRQAAHKPGEWFTQEVTADGNRIVIKVNGKTTVDYVDPHATFKAGHFAIQHHDPGCQVMVRKVEVKELPGG
jgi:hypothetical protein